MVLDVIHCGPEGTKLDKKKQQISQNIIENCSWIVKFQEAYSECFWGMLVVFWPVFLLILAMGKGWKWPSIRRCNGWLKWRNPDGLVYVPSIFGVAFVGKLGFIRWFYYVLLFHSFLRKFRGSGYFWAGRSETESWMSSLGLWMLDYASDLLLYNLLGTWCMESKARNRHLWLRKSYPPRNISMAATRRPGPKRKLIFQPQRFRCELLFLGRVISAKMRDTPELPWHAFCFEQGDGRSS